MTRDELLKRLIKVDGSPIYQKPLPRDSIRRDFSTIDISKDDDLNNFETFFDFEKDIADLESARTQVEKLNQIEDIVNVESNSFTTLNEDDKIKSGNENSFLIFDEEDDTTINTDTIEEIKIESSSMEILDIEDSSILKSEVIENIKFVEVIDNKKEEQLEEGITFKLCKYTKSDGEGCKRQAPKNGDYCSSHRKVLAKENK